MESDPALRSVWRHRWWLVLIAVAAAAASYVVSDRREAEYHAEAVGRVVSAQQARGTVLSVDQLIQLGSSYAEDARSPTAVRRAARAAGGVGVRRFADIVSVDEDDHPGQIAFKARSDDPATARRYADAYLRSYVRYVRDVQNLRRQRLVQPVRQRVFRLRRAISRSRRRPVVVATLSGELQALQARLSEVTAAPVDSVRVVRPADLPSEPESPRPRRDAAIGLLGGLALGVAALYLLFLLRDRYGSGEEASEDLGLALLGGPPRATALSPTAFEAFLELRNRLLFALDDLARSDAGAPVLLVTGPRRGSGRSYVVINLAHAFRASGRRVLVIDGDLRGPARDAALQVTAEPGLANVVEGNGALSPALVTGERGDARAAATGAGESAATAGVPATRVGEAAATAGIPDEDHLHVLVVGSRADDAVDTLQSPRNVIGRLRTSYDVILIDSPPVLGLADTVVLSRYVDGVLLVLDAQRTRRRHARDAAQALRATDAPLLGVIFNRARRRHDPAYYAHRS